MYAVMRSGGKQYRVTPGDILDVERIAAAVGETIEIGDVLMFADGENVKVGSPVLGDAKVVAKVMSHPRGDKIIIFKYKKRKRYRRKTGHRQELTRLKVLDVTA